MNLHKLKQDWRERGRVIGEELKSLIARAEAGETIEESVFVEKKAALEAVKTELARIDAMIQAQKEAEQAVNDYGAPKPEAAKPEMKKLSTPADEFLESAAFQAVQAEMKQFGNNGFPKGYRINTSPVQVKTLTTTLPSSFGGMIDANRIAEIDTVDFSRPLTLLGLVTRAQTSSPIVEYPLHSGFVNNAAPTAQATASSGTSGQKPESDMGTITIGQALVRTIAHHIPVTRQALQDIPAIRGLINTALIYGLQATLETQMLSGDGLGENMQGILSTPGVQNQPLLGSAFDTIRRAIKNVQINGRANPNAILIHPDDWEGLETAQNSSGDYYSGSPFRNTTFSSNVWGVPVVVNQSLTPGTAIVADFRFAYLWESLSPVILLSDSHENYFTRNIIAILAEMRAAFGIIRPSAFCAAQLA